MREQPVEARACETRQQGGRGAAFPCMAALQHTLLLEHRGMPPWLEDILKRNGREKKHIT